MTSGGGSDGGETGMTIGGQRGMGAARDGLCAGACLHGESVIVETAGPGGTSLYGHLALRGDRRWLQLAVNRCPNVIDEAIA